MVSDKFRRQLRHEAEQWQDDGIISADQYQQLAKRYELHEFDVAARDRFIVVLLGLGSLLLGLGIITFVAANWQAIPRLAKLLLLMSLFVGVNASGFYLWKRVPNLPNGRERWQQRLGQGLLLLGALILGANMALMSQMYHLSGSAYELCLAWGLGVLIMAYSLQLTSIGVLSIVVTGIGYWLGIQELTATGMLPALSLLMQYMPIAAGIMFLPLAYWCRSRAIFVLGAIAIFSSFEVVITDLGRLFSDAPGGVVAIALTLPPAFLWSYDDTLWFQLLKRPLPQGDQARPFQPLARGLALLYLIVLIYVLSFHQVWFDYTPDSPLAQGSRLWSTGLPLLLNLNLLVLVGLTVVQWGRLPRRNRWTKKRRFEQTDLAVLALLGVVAVVAFWHWSVFPIQAIATIAFNVVLFLLAAVLMREGLAGGYRRLFWSSMVLLALQILSRMLEYNTGLLLKSLAFVLCGVVVIVVGLWFERYVRTLNSSATLVSPSSQEDLS
ncbi:DUF2157 domain-containing protein [Oculatella sp. LEGE 06141]|uniref:DUF2157 domain-containing protein n=1 Tax=Oculatella sp. LEGE 06141 TaxID=1828648 RepID=UPI001881EF7C|nr:DUF2157 domain-containing protein [Oculatella sp. LEGE 06141]MBE9178235.1 DUF2157 domain-containing protein [Oculatella sp. LEGE 06141]